MTQLERIRDLLSKFTYKPGWTFSIDHEKIWSRDSPYYDWCGIFIKASAPMDNLSGDGSKVLVHTSYGVDSEQAKNMKDEDIVQYIFWRTVWQLEEHEAHEWFKFDGACVFDPHPNG